MPSPLAAPAFHDRLDFPPDCSRCTRRALAFVRATMALRSGEECGAAVDDALLVTAELLANAARHAGGPLALDLSLDPGRRTLRIAVTDAATDPPRKRRLPPPDEPHGRGLHIIDRLATTWGTTPTATGKTVWAELALPAACRQPNGHRPPET